MVRTRANMREVARHANVSVATVSRVLQTPDVVAPKTRERVQQAIEHFSYAPNVQARNLRTARTQLLLALVPDISNPFFSEVIRGIEQIAHDSGYSVLLGDTRNDRSREDAYAELISTHQADGLITLHPRTPAVRMTGRLPVVNACEYVTDSGITSVYVNNVEAARGATDYLIASGHVGIAYIGGPSNSPISTDREEGYRGALATAGLPCEPSLVGTGDFSIEGGIRAANRLIATGRPFTAIFCANDETAFGAISALTMGGLRVPEDVSIIGFDDVHLSRYFQPALTTVAQPKVEIGREAARLLVEILNDPETPPQRRVLPTQLVVRNSVGPRRR